MCVRACMYCYYCSARFAPAGLSSGSAVCAISLALSASRRPLLPVPGPAGAGGAWCRWCAAGAGGARCRRAELVADAPAGVKSIMNDFFAIEPGESKRLVVESPWPQSTSECQRF
jgi:hypothetical protein